MTALYIGVLSGTCADSVDAAAFSFADGCRLVAKLKSPLPAYFPGQIARIQSEKIDIAEYAELGVQIGRWFADSVNALIESQGLRHQDIMVVGMHGQTVMHRPFGECPFSLQLGDPSVVAVQTGLTVVADFRGVDVALGGRVPRWLLLFIRRFWCRQMRPAWSSTLAESRTLVLSESRVRLWHVMSVRGTF